MFLMELTFFLMVEVGTIALETIHYLEIHHLLNLNKMFYGFLQDKPCSTKMYLQFHMRLVNQSSEMDNKKIFEDIHTSLRLKLVLLYSPLP